MTPASDSSPKWEKCINLTDEGVKSRDVIVKRVLGFCTAPCTFYILPASVLHRPRFISVFVKPKAKKDKSLRQVHGGMQNKLRRQLFIENTYNNLNN